jgi:hypothetical protein
MNDRKRDFLNSTNLRSKSIGFGLSNGVKDVRMEGAFLQQPTVSGLVGAGDKRALGVVITTPIRPNGDRHDVGEFDLDQLRAFSLLWDRIAFPDSMLVSIRLATEAEADVEFLRNEGILTRPLVQADVFSGMALLAPALYQQVAFSALDRQEPGQWAVGRNEADVVFPTAEQDEDRGLLFRLTNSLPIPSRAVHLSDVLEFKSQRESELAALRSHLHDIYQSILAAPDRPLAENQALVGLDRSVANYVKVAAETKFPLKLSPLGVKLDGKAILAGGAAFAAASGGMPLAAAALVGLSASVGMVIASFGSTLTLSSARTATPFDYMISMHRDLR